MSRYCAWVAICLFAIVLTARAVDSTNTTPEGIEFAKRLITAMPVQESSLDMTLKIRERKRGIKIDMPAQCRTTLNTNTWQVVYETKPGTNSLPPSTLVITMDGTNGNRYELDGKAVSGKNLFVPFSGSDFWAVDLGMEFLRWPAQRIVKKALRNSRACTVLESTNPEPAPGTYSRVVSWVDQETGGIFHADAYDTKGKRLKEFDVTKFKKVDGSWQLDEMRIINNQTDSRTTL